MVGSKKMKLANTPVVCNICKQKSPNYVMFARHMQIRHPNEARRAQKETRNVGINNAD